METLKQQIRTKANESLKPSPLRVVFQLPAPVKNSRTEVTGDPDVFPRSVLDAPPLFSFQLPSTPSVPTCPPVGKWAGLTHCWA